MTERNDPYSVETMTVTPEVATDWLEHNVENRTVTQRHVETLAREMANGNWMLNGTSITFDKKGRLIDGQHRLWACVTSGVAFQTLVTRGIERRAQDTIDVGAKRRVSTALGMGSSKIESAHTASAIIQAVFALAHRDRGVKVTTTEARAFYEKHPTVKAVTRMLHTSGEGAMPMGMKAKWVGGIYVVAKEFIDRAERGAAFFEVLRTGEPDYVGDAAIAARKSIMYAAERSNVKLTQTAYLSTLTKAFNLFATKSPIERIRPTDEYGIDGFNVDVFTAKL